MTMDYTQDITDTISLDSTDDTKLVFTIDSITLPATTLTDINKIVNPQNNFPEGAHWMLY